MSPIVTEDLMIRQQLAFLMAKETSKHFVFLENIYLCRYVKYRNITSLGTPKQNYTDKPVLK